MAFSTKVIVDTSPDFGDNPQETTESGKPASASLQGLTPNTYHWTKAELYEDGSKVATSEVETFQTLPVGSMTVTYGQYRRTGCHEHYVTYTYTSTYAPSSAILHVTSAGGFTANYQGAIDSQNNSILFDCDDWAGGVVYSCSATLTDVYGAEQTSAVTTLTSGTINAISCSVSGVPTQTSVTLSIDKCLDGGFYNGYVEWWLGTDDPDTDLPQGHSYFQETDSTVTVGNLNPDTDYIFRVSATLDDMQTVVGSAYVHATTAHDYSNDYFYLENTYNGTNTFTLTKKGTPKTTDLSYSFDKITWTRFGLNASAETVTVPQGGRIYLRSSTGLSQSGSAYVAFKMSQTHTAGGHIASLLDYRQMGSYSTTPSYSLYRLFYQDTALTDASGIDFTGVTCIGQYGCEYMFYGCTSLTSAPALTATTLTDYCYCGTFNGCTSLATAPALPATAMADSCYYGMFSGCALASAPALPATTLAHGCYTSMFAGCKSLTAAPALPATTLAEGCYSSMFANCTSLATAPVLPAATMANNCYAYMFNGCTSLESSPALPATTLAQYCYWRMFNGCTALTSAPALPATTMERFCYLEMFYKCTSLRTSPVLPATKLAGSCYMSMFQGCTSLTAITCLATDISAAGCTSYWVYEVAASGTFTKAASMSGWTTGRDGIPSGWTVQDYREPAQ